MTAPDEAREGCECVGYTIRTDYGTGIEHDVDPSSCPTHRNGFFCTGAGDCHAELHAHGCYADVDGRDCDDPDEHPRHLPEGVEVRGDVIAEWYDTHDAITGNSIRPPDVARMTLTDDEQADLRHAHDTGWLTLLAHVTDLCEAYRAQGCVMGDLAHDGTLRAQGEA